MILQRTLQGNWAYCLSQLGNQRLAKASEGMKDRIARGTEDREHFESGAWFAENFNCVNGRILAAKTEFNPLIPYAKQAVAAHKAGQEFYLTQEIVDKKTGKPYSQLLNEIAEADAKKPLWKRRVADLGKAITHVVPTDCFADDDTIVVLAEGKTPARKYGLFLKNDLGFQEVTVRHMPLNARDYSRGFWLYGLGGGDGSGFVCDYRSLGSDYGSVFRVRRDVVTAEGGSQKVREPKVRISLPSFAEVRKYALSKGYITPRDRKDFEAGLRELFDKRNK